MAITLPFATNSTLTISNTAIDMLKKLHKGNENIKFKKAGVVVTELIDENRKQLQLFDEELRENNEEESYLIRLQGEVQNYKNNKRKITSVSLASSTNVDYYTADGYSFARISCGYTMTENGKKSSTVMVYLLRRDDNRRWKIYGWETADQLNSKLEQTIIRTKQAEK